MKIRWFTIPAFVILSGCVEHLLTISLLPDGSSNLILKSKGDARDLYDDDFPHPSGWINDTTWTINKDNQDTTWVLKSQLFSKDSAFVFGPKGRPVIHVLRKVTHENISTSYSLTVRFIGRGVYSKYPKVGPVLLNEAPKDSTQWQRDVLRYLYRKVILDVPFPEKGDLTQERLIHHLELSIDNEYTPIKGQLPDHREFLTAAIRPFQSELPVGYADSLVSALQPYLTELNRLQGLQDDSFVIKAFLPGKLVFTNADSLVQDTLVWKVKLANFIQDDYALAAESVIVSEHSVQRWVLELTGIVLGALLILYGLYRLVRKVRRIP